jgi:serine/threonine protein kinase, bacterial
MFSGDPAETVLINGRYRILQPLQEGGFGHTFLAEDTQLPSRRKCVVKRLKPVADNPNIYQLIQERFQREAAIQEQLGEACDQIPQLYAHFAEGGHFYLVEEWIEGMTLTQKLKDVGRFADAAVRELLVQILSIVDVVHQHQMIHRDIKPDNIIVRSRDGKPVLIDFGAVKETMTTIINAQGETARSIVIGTPGYMAPEQSAGRPLYASDIYGVGLTGIYLVTGKVPTELPCDPTTGKMEWRAAAPHVGNSLADILDKAVAVQPQARFASSQYMRQILQGATSNPHLDEPTISRNPPPISQPAPAPSTLRTQVVAPAAMSVAAAAQTAVVSGQQPSGQQPSIAKPGAQNEWVKALILGGCIGGAILGAVLLLRPKSIPEVLPSPIASDNPSATNSAVPITSPSPASTIPVEPTPATTPSSPPTTNATASCGDPGGTGNTWHPVFMNQANLEQVRSQYCQDAIAKTRDDGTPAVQVASFNSREKAEAFAQKVGGEVGEPYQVGSNTISATSPSPSPAASSSSTVSPSPGTSPAPDGTNAVIIGDTSEKNIRSGPGTDYGVQHIAYSGDRVEILSTTTDKGGYTWHKIYFPKSRATGWIAGQLLQQD